MTLRWASSFDNFQDSDASGVFSSTTVSPGLGGAAIQFGSSYSRWASGKGLRISGSGPGGPSSSSVAVASLLFDAQSTWIVGAAIKPIGLSNSTLLGFALKSGSSYILELRWTGSAWQVTRNGTVVATGAAVGTSAHSYVEFKATIHPSVGSYTVKVNGTIYLSASGVNTSGDGGTTASALELGGSYGGTSGGNWDAYWDDLYIADGSGSGVNDFVGECRPYELLPNANGTFSDWAQTGGTAGQYHTAVSDTPNDGDTSYLASTAIGQRTTLRYPSLSGGTVRAVILAPWLRKDDANTHTVAARTYESGSEHTSSASVQPISTYTHRQIVMETDPLDGAAWSVSKVNASEFGVVVVS